MRDSGWPRFFFLAIVAALVACRQQGRTKVLENPGIRESLKFSGGRTEVPITERDLRTRLYILADDSMSGREAGQAGDVKATAYIAREARRVGLVPGGIGGTFYQNIPMFRRFVDRQSRLSADGVPLVAAEDYFPVLNSGV